MPCNADYMNPTRKELDSKEVAQHLVYVQENLGHEPDADYAAAAKNYYGDVANLDCLVSDLCQILGTLEQTDKPSLERIVYNAHDAQSRKLADWWEEHKKADEKRWALEDAEQRSREAEYQKYLELKRKFEG